MNARDLGDAIVGDTLSVILKYEGDIRKAQDELKAYLQSRKAEPAQAVEDDKDLLH